MKTFDVDLPTPQVHMMMMTSFHAFSHQFSAIVSMGVRGETLTGQLFVWGSSHCILKANLISGIGGGGSGGGGDDDVLAPRHIQLENMDETFER